MSKNDRFLLNGHKMLWHLDRVAAWQRGERIAPIHIDVGLSKGCNIRCRYCFGVMQGNFYRKGADLYFPRDALLRYMHDAGAAGVRSIGLIGEGEPLLNPHVYEAIVAGKDAGVDMALGTNGILYDTGEAGAHALAHLTWIRFNISAASDEAYRRIHGSREFGTAVDKIRFCVEEKHRQNLATTVGLQMVLTPDNVDEALPLATLGRELGVDYLVIKQCSDAPDNTLGVFSRLEEYADYREVLQEAERLRTDEYSVIVKWRMIENRGERCYDRCLGVPFLLYSSGDGKLYPCGMFFDHRAEEFCMGDLVRQTLPEILTSERYWEVVDRIAGEIDVHECYANCRTHSINEFFWKVMRDRPEHINFV